jgi:hypothetical protein
MALVSSPIFLVIVLGAALVFGPIIALFAFGALSLFVWSFRRIWPFLVGIGRWGANWRNFVPFFGLIFVVLTILILLLVYGPRMMLLIILPLLLIIVPIFLFVFVLALVVWVVRLFRLIRLAIS